MDNTLAGYDVLYWHEACLQFKVSSAITDHLDRCGIFSSKVQERHDRMPYMPAPEDFDASWIKTEDPAIGSNSIAVRPSFCVFSLLYHLYESRPKAQLLYRLPSIAKSATNKQYQTASQSAKARDNCLPYSTKSIFVEEVFRQAKRLSEIFTESADYFKD